MYTPNRYVKLPTLYKADIIKDKDPRLGGNVSETSIYYQPDLESPASPTGEMDSLRTESISAVVKTIPSRREELMNELANRRALQQLRVRV